MFIKGGGGVPWVQLCLLRGGGGTLGSAMFIKGGGVP